MELPQSTNPCQLKPSFPAIEQHLFYQLVLFRL
jgi:hypothetical protein